MEDEQEVYGTVEEIIFQNEANGYTIAEVFNEKAKEVYTVVGTLPFVHEGETVRLRGTWGTHSEYGRQFRVTAFEKAVPEDTDAIYKYLSSGVFKGLGPKTAARIVEKYGKDTFDVICNHPEWLSDFRGITARRAFEISAEVKKQMDFYRLLDFCKSHLPMTVALRIYHNIGGGASEALKANPYELLGEIDGYRFEMADAIAKDCGFSKDGAERVFGGTLRVLEQAVANGHTCLPIRTVISETAELLGLEKSLVSTHLQAFVRDGRIGYLHIPNDSRLYIPRNLQMENDIAGRLLHLDRSGVRYGARDIEPLINRAEIESGIQFAPMQRSAILAATDSGVLIITGGPGTGKTTIIKALIRIYESMGCDVALAAPTGRAAKRMSEATSHDARTIHRLLEVEFLDGDRQARFSRNAHNLLDEDVIIIDEASMLDTFLFSALLQAVRPGAKIVLLGDSDQLPSVGAGNILHDLIESECFSVVCLTEIFRQGEASLIVENAHCINRGQLPRLDVKNRDFFFMPRTQDAHLLQTVLDVAVTRLSNRYHLDALSEIQVIVPTRKGICGTENLNRLLQERLNPPSAQKSEFRRGDVVFRTGDKVMQIRNNYELSWSDRGKECFGIFNGDIGIVGKIFPSQKYMMIDFDGREVKYDFALLDDLEHAYAITVHKSQGSEYSYVVLPLTEVAPMLMTRNLLYTAVTRAKKMLVAIGKENVVAKMVENDRETVRYTGLRYLLQSARGKDV